MGNQKEQRTNMLEIDGGSFTTIIIDGGDFVSELTDPVVDGGDFS